MRAIPWTSSSPRGATPDAPSRPHISARVPTLLTAALLAAWLPSVAGAAPPAGYDEASRMREAFGRNMRDGDLEMASVLIHKLLRLEPDNPLLHYNAACVASLGGDVAGAMDELQRAVDLGYDDVRTLETDADFTILRANPAFKRLVEDQSARLLAAADRERLSLADGRWRDIGVLEDRTGSAEIALAMMFDDTGFHLRATGPAGVMRPAGEDTRGGELLVTLTVPDGDGTFDTRRAWRFGFGTADGAPRGRILGLPGRPLHQPLRDLAPVFADGFETGTLVLAADIPWGCLAPHAVPADTLFGVNVGHTGPGRFTQLVRDPAMADPRAEWHRFRPLTVVLDAGSAPRLAARVANAVIGGKPVTVELAAWATRSGEAVLTTGVTGPDGGPVDGPAEISETVALSAGLNVWTRTADLSDLPDGPYRLTARLTPSGDAPLNCDLDVMRYSGRWLTDARDRTKPLSHLERPSVLWRLDLIARGLADRDHRADPGPLWTTVAEVEALLSRAERTGTILPARGLIKIACPADDGRRLEQTLALGAGWRDADDAPLLVVLDAGGLNAPALMVDLAAEGAANGAAARPALPTSRPGAWDADTRVAALAALSWLEARFPARPLRLAVLDGSRAAAELMAELDGETHAAAAFDPDGDLLAELKAWLDAPR